MDNIYKEEKKKRKWGKILYPLTLAVACAVAFVAGRAVENAKTDTTMMLDNINRIDNDSEAKAYQKIADVMRLVTGKYVDTVNVDDLVEKSIPKILSALDPHTVYIPAKDLQQVNDDLAGAFFGIGVQFNIQDDTVHVVAVISGGPSQKVGIMPGDKIVTVDDSLFVGKEITNDKVVKKLRGPEGTHVKVGMKREGEEKLVEFDIVRAEIPMETVDAHYMIDDKTGYVKIDRFGEKTYEEFADALEHLIADDAERYIIDLRGNGGGYLHAVSNMLDLFLPKGDLLVYTQARGEADMSEGSAFRATSNTPLPKAPIIVLIDGFSASASEIFAGAIQDNDRGLIVGKRSFGKGLVQQQYPITGGSALRLTVSRYYTPSGRCIQKHYEEGYDYESEVYKRAESGELYDADSMKKAMADTTEYYTLKLHRKVLAGGGIVPDIFVGTDTSGYNAYYRQSLNRSLIYSFALQYTEKNRAKLSEYKDYKKLRTYINTSKVYDEYCTYAEQKGLKKNAAQIKESKAKIMKLISAYVVRNIIGKDKYGDRPFYSIFNEDDDAIKAAMEAFDSEEMKKIMKAN